MTQGLMVWEGEVIIITSRGMILNGDIITGDIESCGRKVFKYVVEGIKMDEERPLSDSQFPIGYAGAVPPLNRCLNRNILPDFTGSNITDSNEPLCPRTYAGACHH